MFCDQCGGRVGVYDTLCPHCGADLTSLAGTAAIPPTPIAVPAPRAALPIERLAGVMVPAPGPRPRVWLSGLWVRNLRGTVIGIVAAWFGLPFILLMAGLGAIVGGLAGVVSGTFVGRGVLGRLNTLLKWIFPLPVSAEQLLPTAAAQIGGIVGGLIGAVSGALHLAWDAAVWPWLALYAGDPVWPWAVAIGQVVTALVVGMLFVSWCTVTESVRLRISGARRLSRREAAWLDPLVAEVAERLGIRTPPRLLIDDRRQVNAICGIRYIVLYRGLLDEVEYDQAAVKGLLAHEMAHWRDGDAIAAAWAKGVALPLYLLYAMASALLRAARARPLQLAVRVLLWSVLVTVDYIMIPVQAGVWRRGEYAADAIAADAGYGDGLRQVLTRMRSSFETGRDGWDLAICATHPPTELRLERLERPGQRYPVGDDGTGLGLGAMTGRTSSVWKD